MLRIPITQSSTPCPACGSYVLPAGRVCPDCGYVYPVVASDPTPDQPLTGADWQALLLRVAREVDDDPDA